MAGVTEHATEPPPSAMEINDLHPPDDYSHRFFIWHEWIQANGPLTAENVFEYFSTSMFYDKQSNNQVLRMQTIFTGQPLMNVNEAEELKRFTGVEFAVVHAEPPSLFIIHKRERLSPEEVKPLAAYFIMNNRIYQAPDIYTVLSNRLLTSLNAIQMSLEIIRKNRPDYTPRTGFVWPIVDPSLTTDANKKQDEDGEREEASSETKANSSPSKKLQNNMLLMNAMRTTAAHSQNALSSSLLARNAEAGTAPDTVAATAAARSSATPAPMSVAPTPKPVGQDSKGPTTKKKRKKTLNTNAPESTT